MRVMIKNFNEFIFESTKNLKFFFDMDGVLADFDAGIEKDSRYDELQRRKGLLFSYVKDKLNREVSSIDEVKPMLASGDLVLKKLYDDAHDFLHDIAEEKGFFLNLPPMKDAERMLIAAKEISGVLPTILTAPVDSYHSAPEKVQWMKNHFDGLYDTVIVDKQKYKYANGPSTVLVDDRVKYVKTFGDAGGSTIHHKDPEETISLMRKF